jgi:hypothetical protein
MVCHYCCHDYSAIRHWNRFINCIDNDDPKDKTFVVTWNSDNVMLSVKNNKYALERFERYAERLNISHWRKSVSTSGKRMTYFTYLPDRVYQSWIAQLQRLEQKYKIERDTDRDYHFTFDEWLEAKGY